MMVNKLNKLNSINCFKLVRSILYYRQSTHLLHCHLNKNTEKLFVNFDKKNIKSTKAATPLMKMERVLGKKVVKEISNKLLETQVD